MNLFGIFRGSRNGAKSTYDSRVLHSMEFIQREFPLKITE
jgi:hypothetical protein